MINIDSLARVDFKTNIDSLNHIYTVKFDSLSTIINQHKISEGYFHDILSHQWTLLSIQTGIFVCIITILLALAAFISWNTIFKKILHGNAELKKQLAITPDILKKLNDNTNLALRVAYESATHTGWIVVWHLRYIEWFVDNIDKNNVECAIKKGLILRCKKLMQEYENLKNSPKQYEWFKSFENKGGLKRALKKIIDSDIKEVIPITLEIFKDLS